MRMLLNIGGGNTQTYGVHAHMNIDHDIYYAAEDESRQEITWVSPVIRAAKKRSSQQKSLSGRMPARRPNRSAKWIASTAIIALRINLIPPYSLMNSAIQYGIIDANIPKIKEKGVDMLSGEYPSAMVAQDQSGKP